MGVEIEKKFTVRELPADLDRYPHHVIEQGYLNVSPAIRVRREDSSFYMTYKASHEPWQDSSFSGERPIGKTEYNLPLDEQSYIHLLAKADGNVIRKKRYIIPLNDDAFDKEQIQSHPQLVRALENGEIRIELDVFEDVFDGRILAEVEFPTEEAARLYKPAGWFDTDVTGDPAYSNARMSREIF
jgi:CYTH domain-containing protein